MKMAPAVTFRAANFFTRIGVAGAAAATTGPVPAAAQTPAMATEVSLDDRFRIQDVLRSYVGQRLG